MKDILTRCHLMSFDKIKLLGLILVFAYIASPALGHDLYEWVGVSDSMVLPIGGLHVLSEQCGIKFKNSRMCTSQEIVLTAEIPPSLPDDAEAWIQPVFAGGFQSAPGIFRIVEKYSGFIDRSTGLLSCGRWNQPLEMFSGLSVLLAPPVGTISTEACDREAYVACCAPKGK